VLIWLGGALSPSISRIPDTRASGQIDHQRARGIRTVTRRAPPRPFDRGTRRLTPHAVRGDFRADVHDLLQEGDKVVARVSFVATHTGEFMGVPASGNPVNIDAIDILQFRGDLCVAHWGIMDMAGALAQMGAGPHT